VRVQSESCHLERDLETLLRHSQEVAAALQRLRQDLGGCPGCRHRRSCPLRQSFNLQVAQAIEAINLEFDTTLTCQRLSCYPDYSSE
jgi:hypothetical protein